MLLVPFPCPFLVCGALVHCFKLGISLVQFCFIIKNEHGVLWGFFLPISPVDHGGNKDEHRVSLHKISRPNIATNPVAQRALPPLIRRTFHAAAGCQLSPRFLPVLTPAHVHLGQCRLLTLAPWRRPETRTVSLWASSTVQSDLEGECPVVRATAL